MRPTPYRWTTDENLTHVLYDNFMPPTTGFGWSSLCDALRVPIEGEHLEVDEDVAETDITCHACQRRLNEGFTNVDSDSSAVVDGCLVRIERNEAGVIVDAERVCGNQLHLELPFESESFTGNLTDTVDEVCKDCWEEYVNDQWGSDAEGAELRVEVREKHGLSEYHGAQAEAVRDGRKGTLRLVSEHGLEKDVPQRQIESIVLTPKQQVNY